MDRLGQRLSQDADLVTKKVVARVLSDKPGNTLEPWETTGTGAVALREEATYGKIRVFCALFPAGIRLAEEDSLNIATFKTDDAESFNVAKCLERHLLGRVNLLPQDERSLLMQVLNSDAVRTRPVHLRFRYVLAVLGQREASQQPVNWEVAGAYLYELNLIPDFDLKSGSLNVQVAPEPRNASKYFWAATRRSARIWKILPKSTTYTMRRSGRTWLFTSPTGTHLKPEAWLPDICHDDEWRDKLSFESWKFATPTTGVHITLKPLQDPRADESGQGHRVQTGRPHE